jgi:hypothetical protein
MWDSYIQGANVRLKSALLMSVLLTGMSAAAYAGPYADDLSKCLVSSTNKDDRLQLVKWMFVAMGTHPAVRTVASVTPQQVDAANQSTAKLFTRLLTQDCAGQAQKALQYEGPATIELSFQLLGQVAARELFTDPSVMTAMKGLTNYLDQKQLAAVLQVKSAPLGGAAPTR